MVASADVNYTMLQPFKIFTGIYQDFSAKWYTDVGGNLIYTYAFIVFWPFIDWPVKLISYKLGVWWD